MLRCFRCEETDPRKFQKKSSSKTGYQAYCRECHNKCTKNHYNNNKDYYKNKAKNRVLPSKKWLAEYKAKQVCFLCGFDHQAAIVFHHIDGNKKEAEIYKLASAGRDIEYIKKEIAKCIPLCSNCHLLLHWKHNKGITTDLYIPKTKKTSKKNRKVEYIPKTKIKWPDKTTLARLVWEKPTQQISKDLGVSDVAITKMCKKLGIQKPKRGYWTKIKFNKTI